jgi:hypothetical protein
MAINGTMRASRSRPAALARIVCASGSSIPPPMPWKMRKAMRLPVDHAMPHNAEPVTKTVSETIQERRAPKRWKAQPLTGMVIATASA